jgi:hypothetical protein
MPSQRPTSCRSQSTPHAEVRYQQTLQFRDGRLPGSDRVRDDGRGPKEIVVTVVGDCFDLQSLTMRGPIIRSETIVLVKPMVEQVIEMSTTAEE